MRSRLVHYLYDFEHGVRLTIPPGADRRRRPGKRWSRDASHGCMNTQAEVAAIGDRAGHRYSHCPSCPSRSSAATGSSAASRSRTSSASTRSAKSDVRLLMTVASSMGVALENARLFDETQRLFKETEQRAAELAVINSIQQGMAGEARLPERSSISSATSCVRCSGPATSASAGYDDEDEPQSLPVRLRARQAADDPADPHRLRAACSRRWHARGEPLC